MSTPTAEEVEDFLLSCRYGELEEVKEFVEKFGREAVVEAKDERGNTCLHMCCGNGHLDVLEYLLPFTPAATISQTNEAGSPPLHWAILNNHVAIVRYLVEWPEEKGGGILLLKQKSKAGRDAFSEALFAGEGKEEVAGWIEGYLWRIEGGDEDEQEGKGGGGGGGDGVEGGDDEIKVEDGDEVAKEEAEAVDEIVERTAEVDIAKTS
ncbi:ankyrin repeat-containing domain protein [Naematelia encephala]|uniref:Ankyrin repeat-containing domain protein n=1 Tax=Naematelia encephala TaxID=71784 RepID=A0A1Y2BIT6_9TREE|nr:ankyrin repeat-containing domain protein [Naematelia encephala]